MTMKTLPLSAWEASYFSDCIMKEKQEGTLLDVNSEYFRSRLYDRIQKAD